MPRLLIVTPTYIAYKVFLRGLAKELSEQGWTIDLACSTSTYPAAVDAEDHVTMHEIDFPRGQKPWGYFRAARQLNSLVRVIRPALVHVHFSSAIMTVAMARRAHWPPTLGTFQGLVHPLQTGIRRPVYRVLERWGASRMDQSWVLTPGDLEALRGIRGARIQGTKGFGVDRQRFDPARFSTADRSQQRQQWGIPDAALVFAYVGRFVHFKGFPEVVRSAMAVTEKHRDVHFVLVGTRDPLHAAGVTDAEWQRLQTSSRIHFVGWTDDVPRVLQAVDCFVFPSEREGMAVCIMESLSMGVPVITTSARGCGELVQDQHNGWIVAKQTADVEAAIEHIVGDPACLQQTSREALQSSIPLDRQNYIREQIVIYQGAV